MYDDIKKKPIVRGIKKWENKNGFTVLMLHYTADPEKDPQRKGKKWYDREKKGTLKALWDKEYEIDFATKSGKLIYGSDYCDFKPEVHLINSFELEQPYELILALDFGQRNPTAALVGAWTKNQELYIIDEYYEAALPSKSSKSMFQHFDYLLGGKDNIEGKSLRQLRDIANTYFQIRVIDPTTGHKNRSKITEGEEIPYSVVEEFYDNGWEFERGNNDVAAGINRIREYFQLDADSKSHLYVFRDKCPNLCTELQNYRYKELTELQQKTRNMSEEPVKKDDHACVIGSSIVHTTDGDIAIKDLVGKKGHVYGFSQQLERITVAPFNNVAKTGKRETIQIILDNKEKLVLTEDHPVLLRNGEYKEAGKLKIGDSLMPLYRNIDSNGHLHINLNNGSTKSAHRLVYQDIIGELPEDSWKWNIHHLNEDKLNNNPDNLQLLTRADHCAIHSKNRKCSKTTKRKLGIASIKNWIRKDYRIAGINHLDSIRHLTKAWHKSEEGKKWHKQHAKNAWSEENRKKRRQEKQCKVCERMFTTEDGTGIYCSGACYIKNRIASGIDNINRECFICNKEFNINKYTTTKTCSLKCYKKYRSILKKQYNHKIVDIKRGEKQYVYNMEVKGIHNFACQGVIVHNCDALRYMIMTRPNAPYKLPKPKTRIQKDIEGLLRPKMSNDWDYN